MFSSPQSRSNGSRHPRSPPVDVDEDLMVFRGVQDLDAAASCGGSVDNDAMMLDDTGDNHVVSAYDDAFNLSHPQHVEPYHDQQYHHQEQQYHYPPSIICGDEFSIVSSSAPPPLPQQQNEQPDLIQFYPEQIEYNNSYSSSPASVSTVTIGGDRPPRDVLICQHHPDYNTASAAAGASAWRQGGSSPNRTTEQPDDDAGLCVLGGCQRRIYVCLGLVVVMTIAASAFITTVVLTQDKLAAAPPKPPPATTVAAKDPATAAAAAPNIPMVSTPTVSTLAPVVPRLPQMATVAPSAAATSASLDTSTATPTIRATTSIVTATELSPTTAEANEASSSFPTTSLPTTPTPILVTTLSPMFAVKQERLSTVKPTVSPPIKAPVKQPTAATTTGSAVTKAPALAPAASSSASLPAPAILSANHVIQWGTFTTCNSTSTLTNQDDESFTLGVGVDIVVSCQGTGTIQVQDEVNCVCDPIGTLLLSTAAASSVGCRFASSSSSYGVTSASVIVTCVGDSASSVVAHAEVAARAAGVCPASNGTGRRLRRQRRGLRLSSASSSRLVVPSSKKDGDVTSRRTLFAPPSPTNEGAASFVQVGRFCNADTELWHEVYPCQAGQRLVTTEMGLPWSGISAPDLADLNDTSSPSRTSTTAAGSSSNASSLFDGRFSGSSWQTAGVQNFCFSARWPCNVGGGGDASFTSSSSSGCSVGGTSNSSLCLQDLTCVARVGQVQMANVDSRSSCYTVHAAASTAAQLSAPVLARLKGLVDEEMSTLAFGRWMDRELQAVAPSPPAQGPSNTSQASSNTAP